MIGIWIIRRPKITSGGNMLFDVLKWLHVLAAVTAVGANITYGVWIRRASRTPETLLFTLQGIRAIDDRLANPGFGALLITGVLMLLVLRLPLTTPWVVVALVLYFVMGAVAFRGFTPTLRDLIRILESEGFDSPRYQAVARRGMTLGITLLVIAAVIIFLMVVRPPLWG